MYGTLKGVTICRSLATQASLYAQRLHSIVSFYARLAPIRDHRLSPPSHLLLRHQTTAILA